LPVTVVLDERIIAEVLVEALIVPAAL